MFKEAIIAMQMACLSEALYYEARGEGYDGLRAVAAVIHNRAVHSRWEDDYCSVLEEPHQFSYLGNNAAGSMPMTDNDSVEKINNIVEDFMETVDNTPVMENVLYFHNSSMTPSDWNFDLLRRVKIIGNHVFYTYR